MDASPALVNNVSQIWAFALAGRVKFTDLSSVKATNRRNGFEWEGLVEEGRFKAIVIDPNQQSIVQIGDRIDVSVFGQDGTRVSEKLVMYVSQQDIIRAYRIVRLEQRLIPDQTRLIPNYPNPSNPETWIPFELEQASNVQLTIFDSRGSTILQLDLGHQVAGRSLSKNRAAYWDGQNQLGEPVSSGIYFYTLIYIQICDSNLY